jgi:phospholipase C
MDKHIFFRSLSTLSLLLLVCSVVGCQMFSQQTSVTPTTPTPSGSHPVGATTTPTVAPTSAATPAKTVPPRPDHVVVVMEENHAFSEIIGSSSAPYMNALAGQGASFTNSHAITHPSEPNYLALFSGSTQGLASDACPLSFTGPNLATELLAAKDSFGGYSEDLPNVGFTGCVAPDDFNPLYARKHNPWVSFTNVAASVNMPWTSFPTDYQSLPTVSFVIPNQLNDMHSGSISQADSWLKSNLDGYVQWAKTHNSLLIVTWDEDDGSTANQIPTFFVGPMVKTGQYSESINHYNVLRTLEAMYGLPYAGESANASAITDIWQ